MTDMRPDQFRAEIPPALLSAESEAAVLAGLVRDNRKIDRVAEILAAEDFGEPAYGRIYSAILSTAACGRPVNALTLIPLLAGDPAVEEVGGRLFLADLGASALGLLVSIDMAKHVKALATRRRLIDALHQAAAAASRLDVDLPSAIDMAMSGMDGADGLDADRPSMTIEQALGGVIERTWAIREGRAQPALLLSRLRDWNDVTGGMRGGDLILLAGRPGMGKTAKSLAIARRAAEAGYGVLYISREMKTEQLALRVAADMLFEAGSPITFKQIMAGDVDNAGMRAFDDAKAVAAALPIIVEQPASLAANRIGTMVRRHQRGMAARGWKLGLIIVDYLGLLEPPSGKGNREQEVSAISRELKAVAAAANAPLIALSQLSRAVEQREDKRPVLSDLRDSGSLEQDADCVVFVYREEYYLRLAEPAPHDVTKRDEWESRMHEARDRVEVYSAKVRQGEPTRRRGYFFGSRQAVRNSDYFETGHG